MWQRSLLIVVTLFLLLITAALLVVEAGNSNVQAAIVETDYVSVDNSSLQTTIHAAPQTTHTILDDRILAIITAEELDETENQGIPPEDIELDYGAAALIELN